MLPDPHQRLWFRLLLELACSTHREAKAQISDPENLPGPPAESFAPACFAGLHSEQHCSAEQLELEELLLDRFARPIRGNTFEVSGWHEHRSLTRESYQLLCRIRPLLVRACCPRDSVSLFENGLQL